MMRNIYLNIFLSVARNVEATLTYGDPANGDKVTEQLTGLNATIPAVLPRGKTAKSLRIDIRAENLGQNNSYVGLTELKVCYTKP